MAVNKYIQLNNPTIEINGEIVAIVPNTGAIKDGKGTIQVNVSSSGGNGTVKTHARNMEDAKKMLKVSIRATESNQNRIQSWRDNMANNAIAISFVDSGAVFNIQKASLITDPEFTFDVDGAVELEFEG